MSEAERILNIYNESKKNLDFTLFMCTLEKDNKELFNEIIKLLNTGNYEVKYLNTTGTSI